MAISWTMRDRDRFADDDPDDATATSEPSLRICMAVGVGYAGLLGVLFVMWNGLAWSHLPAAMLIGAVFGVFGLRRMRPVAYLAAIVLVVVTCVGLVLGGAPGLTR